MKPLRYIRSLVSSLPLPIKAISIGLCCGVLVWVALDKFQSKATDKILLADLKRELEYLTHESRSSLTQRLEAHSPAAKLLAKQEPLKTYMQSANWPAGKPETITELRASPGWLPPTSEWRQLVRPTHFLLLDQNNFVQEVYSIRGDPLPEHLLPFEPLTLIHSLGQTYLGNVEGQPVALARSKIFGQDKKFLGSLMIISVVDSEYLEIAMQGLDLRFALVALVDPSDNSVIASSDTSRLSQGSVLNNIHQKYLVDGLDYHSFGDGASELQYQFITLLQKSLAAEINSQVISLDHRNRLITAVAFIVTFGVLIFIVSIRIEKMVNYVERFTQRMPGIYKLVDKSEGDQITRLGQQITLYTEIEQLYRALFEINVSMMLLIDPDTSTILDANQSACSFYGYSKETLIKMRITDLNVLSKKEIYEEMERSKSEKKNYFNFRHRLSDGTIRDVEVFSGPIIVSGQSLLCSIIHDVSARKLAEKERDKLIQELQYEIAERKKAEGLVKASLREKEVLLKEIHHRVKNNMVVITSLLQMQSVHIEEERYLRMFRNSIDRIKSMALIHEKLYRTEDLAKVDFNDYLRDMINSMFMSYGLDPKKISLKTTIESVSLGVDTAIPCGLIINELISNSLKYAFPDDREGEIRVGIHLNDKGEFELTVSDNGVGIPENVDINSSDSLV